jgi:hypothetical protein
MGRFNDVIDKDGIFRCEKGHKITSLQTKNLLNDYECYIIQNGELKRHNEPTELNLYGYCGICFKNNGSRYQGDFWYEFKVEFIDGKVVNDRGGIEVVDSPSIRKNK